MTEEITLMQRIENIEALLVVATEGDWRTVPDSRPMVYTDCSRGWTPTSEVYYGGYMGTGEIAEFSKYDAANADAELTVALHNAAPILVAEIRRLQGEVASRNETTLRAEQRRDSVVDLLRSITPTHLHHDTAGMCLWLRDSINHVRATD